MARPTDDPKTFRLDLRFQPDLIAEIDEWRRHQPDIPPRAEAIRRLVQLGLALHEIGGRERAVKESLLARPSLPGLTPEAKAELEIQVAYASLLLETIAHASEAARRDGGVDAILDPAAGSGGTLLAAMRLLSDPAKAGQFFTPAHVVRQMVELMSADTNLLAMKEDIVLLREAAAAPDRLAAGRAILPKLKTAQIRESAESWLKDGAPAAGGTLRELLELIKGQPPGATEPKP